MLRGGGLAVVAVLAGAGRPRHTWAVLGRARAFGAAADAGGVLGRAERFRWRDDRKSLPVRVRLAGEVAAIVLGFAASPSSALVFQGRCRRRSTARRAASAGSGLSTSTISWTASTASAGVETADVAGGLSPLYLCRAGCWPPLGIGGRRGAAAGFLSGTGRRRASSWATSAASRCGFLIGCPARAGRGRTAVRGAHPAALLRGRCNAHAALRASARREAWQAHRSMPIRSPPPPLAPVGRPPNLGIEYRAGRSPTTAAVRRPCGGGTCLIVVLGLQGGVTLKFRQIAFNPRARKQRPVSNRMMHLSYRTTPNQFRWIGSSAPQWYAALPAC